MNVGVTKISELPSVSVVIYCGMKRNMTLNATWERIGRNKAPAEWFKVLSRNSQRECEEKLK